jgi:hypothetical protein
MNVGEILRVQLNYNVPNASAVQNVFWYVLAGSNLPDEDVPAVFVAWAEFDWGAAWEVAADQLVSIDTVSLDVVNPDGTVARDLGESAVGLFGAQVTSDNTPGVVSGFIKADTALPKSRGSKYIPGFTDGLLAAGLWNTTATNVLLDCLVEYISTVGAGTSSFIPGVLRRVAAAFEPFIGTGDTTDVPAYQRRRKPNVGA